MNDSIFESWKQDSLVWMPEHGMGFFPVAAMPYDHAYFEKYQKYEGTPVAEAINAARNGLVSRHWKGEVVDVGIGSGEFIRSRPECLTYGFDVNPAGVTWLQQRGLYRDIYAHKFAALSFWDSLEHIPHPAQALAQAEKFVFVSLPIFENVEHVLMSKHYRKDEHYWYFTADGFVKWMHHHGFELLETNRDEVAAGREDIGSFAFRRV